jgi:hypothetical protein
MRRNCWGMSRSHISGAGREPKRSYNMLDRQIELCRYFMHTLNQRSVSIYLVTCSSHPSHSENTIHFVRLLDNVTYLEIGVILSISWNSTWSTLALTSSGRGAAAAALSSSSYLAMRAWSIWTSGGARAGAATKSRVWLLHVSSCKQRSMKLTQRAFVRAIGKASRSCTVNCQYRSRETEARVQGVRWTWQRSRSTGGSLNLSAINLDKHTRVTYSFGGK